MADAPPLLAPDPSKSAQYQASYRRAIAGIEAELRRGEIPDFNGEVARLLSRGRAEDLGRMAAYSDYRLMLSGKIPATREHPCIQFREVPAAEPPAAGRYAYAAVDIQWTVSVRGNPRNFALSGAIDADRLFPTDRDRIEDDPHYICRTLRVSDETTHGMMVEKTFFIRVDRHPVTRARRPLLARTD